MEDVDLVPVFGEVIKAQKRTFALDPPPSF